MCGPGERVRAVRFVRGGDDLARAIAGSAKKFFRSVHIESRPAYIFTEISVQTAAYGFPIAPASFRLKRNVRVFAFVRGYNAAAGRRRCACAVGLRFDVRLR